MTNDHRESIRDAATRHAQYARWAMMAEADNLPHAFEPDADADFPEDVCAVCGWAQADEDEHGPEGFDPDEWTDGLAGLLLDVTVWRADDLSRVELLLTCGGPTVGVAVDEADRVSYHHSWGRSDNPDENGDYPDARDYWPSGDDAAAWVEIADYYREGGH